MSEFTKVATLSDLPPGAILPVTVGGRDMIVYRDGEHVYASQRRCLHQGADLADGILARGFLVCAQHGWRFHAATGVHDMSPMNCLITYRVQVDGDDVLIDPTPIRRAEAP